MLPFQGTALDVRIGVEGGHFTSSRRVTQFRRSSLLPTPTTLTTPAPKLAVHLDRGQLRITYGTAALAAVRLFEVPLGLDVIVRLERQVRTALVTAHAIDDHVERDRLTLSRRLVGHAVCPHAIFG
jgi:hypothetical protein